METSPIDEVPNEKKGFFRPGRAGSPQKQPSPFDEEEVPDNSDFVFVESPNSKARAMRALQREQNGSVDFSSSMAADMEMLADTPPKNGPAQPVKPTKNRTKNLPTPPVMPVLPDFDDFMTARTVPRDDGVKRKTSVVKKLRERIK